MQIQSVDDAHAEDFGRIRQTQVDNVMRILKHSYKRLQISLILPKMSDDIGAVEEELRGTFYSPAIEILKKMKNMPITTAKKVIDKDVLEAINYFHANYHMVEKFPRYLNSLNEADKTLLFAFEKLVAVAHRHLQRTAMSEIDMERQLFTMYQEREETKKRIEESKRNLRSKNALLRWKRGAQFLLLDKLETDLASRKWKNSVRIQNEIEKRARILRTSHMHNKITQHELEQELEVAQNKYQQMVLEQAKKDKDIRAEKEKLLILLGNLLHKYDNNISEKLKENLELEDQYKVAKKELDNFMKIYRREEAVYKRIVVQYEEEERRKQQQNILLFMMNRAARTIQTYWQKWRRDKAKRDRKARKGKKGKK